MEIVILLVPLAILLVVLGVAAFLWALRRGQFDDLDSPQWRVVFDDQRERPGKKDKETDTDDAD
jgi:cbb3-type cytochrome oxidase maturation protein